MAGLRLRALVIDAGTDWSRCDDHGVIAELVAALAQGRLHGSALPAAKLYRLAPVTASGAAPPPASSPSPRATSAAASGASATSAAAPAPTTFGALNTPAMVAALQQAAQDGVPFCEECTVEPAP
jgi:hypothetical protein